MARRACNLVTGALGFVGLHLIEQLLRAGIPVVGVGRLDSGQQAPEAVRGFTLTGPAPGLADAVAYRGDAGSWFFVDCALEDPGPILQIVGELRPTAVYHLAAQSSAALSFREPLDTLNSNVIGTLNLLEAVRNLGEAERPVVLAVGSCEEYGDHPHHRRPLTEENTLRPVSPYGVSKVAQTLLCCQYARSYQLPVIVARAFSHTGPGQDPRFVFPSFAAQIARAEAGDGPAEIDVGDLTPVRDFLDVRDVVAAYRLLVKEGQPGEIYNVSAGQPLTIGDGLAILLRAAGRPVTTREDAARLRPTEIPFMVGDSRKLRARTGWRPEFALAQTLIELLEESREERA